MDDEHLPGRSVRIALDDQEDQHNLPSSPEDGTTGIQLFFVHFPAGLTLYGHNIKRILYNIKVTMGRLKL